MAAIAGTQTRHNMVGVREDLSDVIYRIDPEDTPFMSAIGRGPRAKQTYVEWQTDSLAAPDDDNAVVEGDEASFVKPDPTVRLGNHTQISRKTAITSGTADAVDAAGRKREMAYQVSKRGVELRRDQEKILLKNRGADAGSETTPRYLAPLLAFIKTNVDMSTDATTPGANPVYTSGAPTTGRTDGATRPFTEAILKNVLQMVWSSGGKPKVLMVGPVNKALVSTFEGIAQRTVDVAKTSKATIIAAADVYVSDYGVTRVVPNRWQRERDAFVLDPEHASVRYLRPHKSTPLAKTGDAEKRLIITEWTLQVNQEAALGLAADLGG